MTAPITPLPPRARTARRQSRPVLKTFVWIIVLLLLGVGGYAGYLYYQIDNAISTMGTSTAVPPSKSAKVKPLTLLLMGKDTRNETGSLNTDVIMIAALNPTNKSATVVSVPRDTYVKLNGYRSGKANAIYANFYVNSKSKAFSQTKEMLGKWMSVPIDYMAMIDFKGFEQMVDQVGGLTLDIDQDMCYRDSSDGTNIRLKQGSQTLNGEKTLDFVRYRHSNCSPPTPESNDIERNARQSQVLNQMVGKLLTVGTITKIGPMIESMGKNMETDIPSEQIRYLIQTYIGIDRDKIKYIHLQGTWQSPYINLEPQELKAAQEALKQQLR